MIKPKDTMHVLMPTPNFFPAMGGVEVHVYQVARRLVAQGIEVTVLTTDREGLWPESDDIDGIKVIRVRAWPREKDWHYAPDLFRIIPDGKHKWDLIHIQSYHTFVAPFAMFAAARAKIPYVITPHSGGHASWFRNSIRNIQRLAYYPLFTQAKKIISVSQFELEIYGKMFPRDLLTLIPNGFEPFSLEKSPGSKDTLPADPQKPLILSVGRLEPNKGHQKLISALPYVLAQRPSARLWIVGTGSHEKELRQLAQNLGVTEQVEIRGILPNNRLEMADALRSASVVALLSDYENHPIAVLEALAMKRPVLVNDNSGLREIAQRGWARAIPTHSKPADIASALLDQIDNPLISRDFEIFTWDDCTKQILALYQQILSTG